MDKEKNTRQLTSRTIEWLRFPLIVAVVLLHSGENGVTGGDAYSTLCVLLSHGICKIAVPCFFFISGYLFFTNLKKWDTQVWAKKLTSRIRTLLIPYLLWNILAFVVMYLYGLLRGSVNGWEAVSFVDALRDHGWLNIFWGCTYGCPVDYPLWFLRDLIIFVIATPLVYVCAKHFRFLAMVLVFIGFWFSRSRDLEGLWYFMLGAWMRVGSMDPVKEFSRWKWVSYIVATLLLVGIGITYRDHHVAYEYIKYAFVAAGVCATFCFASSNLERGLFKENKWLAKASFFVFCAHAILILHDISHYVILHLLPQTQVWLCVGLFLKAALAVGICLGLYWLMKRFTPRTLKVLMGSR